MRKLIFVLLFLISCTPQVTVTVPPSVTPPNFYFAAADFYVSPDGNLDCKTVQTSCGLQAAISQSTSGQIILVRAGEYTGNFVVNKDIAIKAYPNEFPIFTNSSFVVSGDRGLIEGLTFRYANLGVSVVGNYNSFIDVNVYSNNVGVEVAGSNNLFSRGVFNNNVLGFQLTGNYNAIRNSQLNLNQQDIIFGGVDNVLESNGTILND